MMNLDVNEGFQMGLQDPSSGFGLWGGGNESLEATATMTTTTTTNEDDFDGAVAMTTMPPMQAQSGQMSWQRATQPSLRILSVWRGTSE